MMRRCAPFPPARRALGYLTATHAASWRSVTQRMQNLRYTGSIIRYNAIPAAPPLENKQLSGLWARTQLSEKRALNKD